MPLLLDGVDDQPDSMQADGIHPVVSAQGVMLNNVWKVLVGLL